MDTVAVVAQKPMAPKAYKYCFFIVFLSESNIFVIISQNLHFGQQIYQGFLNKKRADTESVLTQILGSLPPFPERDFGSNQRLESPIILCVYRAFQSEELGQKILRKKKKVCTENQYRLNSYFRPNLLLKRSTRPPVSTSFCLPV